MNYIWKIFVKIVKGIWDVLSYFFGFPYEAQANKIDSEKIDPLFRGPENEKSDQKIYRANKVSN
ncbi:hypothetical protein GJV85_12900 [Sulfurimonas aquatica]|uniref:Uncharacterized protein n=1 Tax=Sulfurimonas aquatica TaxID=2672570 RepID=A0A975GDU9_9BACT|nr:hypothetical protein [Sulfurimonas aquatica]QSZ42967.1 hypothetical protein GJV85_12900 [Sulfurimonas aquatica]